MAEDLEVQLQQLDEKLVRLDKRLATLAPTSSTTPPKVKQGPSALRAVLRWSRNVLAAAEAGDLLQVHHLLASAPSEQVLDDMVAACKPKSSERRALLSILRNTTETSTLEAEVLVAGRLLCEELAGRAPADPEVMAVLCKMAADPALSAQVGNMLGQTPLLEPLAQRFLDRAAASQDSVVELYPDLQLLAAMLLGARSRLPGNSIVLKVPFVLAVLTTLQTGYQSDVGQVIDPAASVILAVSERFHSPGASPLVEALRSLPESASSFGESLVRRFNWAKTEDELRRCIAALTEIVSHPSTADALYANDVRLVLELVARNLRNLEETDEMREPLLHLLRYLLVNCTDLDKVGFDREDIVELLEQIRDGDETTSVVVDIVREILKDAAVQLRIQFQDAD